MTSPYLLRPLRSLAEISREPPANGSAGKTSVSTPGLHAYLRTFIARYPTSSDGRRELARSAPRAEIRANNDSAKPARLVWTNDAQPARTRRRRWRLRREEPED